MFDGADGAVLLLDQVELAADAQRLRADLHATRVQGIAFLAGAMLQGRVIDATV